MANNDKHYQRAQKRVKEIKGFYEHLAAFVITITFLGVLTAVTVALDFLPGWLNTLVLGGFVLTIWGWGMGITFHAWSVYSFMFFGKDWEAQKTAELLGEAPYKRKNILSEDYFTSEAEEQPLQHHTH